MKKNLSTNVNNLIEDRKTINDRPSWIFYVALLMGFATSAFLFYRQITMSTKGYASDLIYYVLESEKEGSSRYVTNLFRLLTQIFGSKVPIAVYMGIVIVGIICVTRAIIQEFLRIDGIRADRYFVDIFSASIVFTGSIYIPIVQPYFYKVGWASFAWHSPTQQSMIFFALVSMLFLTKILATYMYEIKFRYWVPMMIGAVLSTWAKPSFLLTFTPAIIVVFVTELILQRGDGKSGERLRRLFAVGFAYVPAGMLFIYFIFWYKTSQKGNEIFLGLERFLDTNPSLIRVAVSAVLVLALPITVFFFNANKIKDLRYNLAFWMLMFGILEWIFIYEVGDHSNDGNFDWGKQWGIFYTYVLSFAVILENYFDKDFLCDKKGLRKAYFTVASVIYVSMLITRLYYYRQLMRGANFWM